MVSEGLIRFLCRTEDITKQWEPLSVRHANIFNELKDIIKTYVEERCGEKVRSDCIVPVLYGIFGSGKSTLSVELCKWALSEGIPATRVYLADIIKYIREELHKDEVPESDLPNYIESFFEDYLRRNGFVEEIKRGVLFIDEVEESYEELKKLVKGASLLRGTTDKARTGTLKVLPVLIFAPSSALAEALRFATIWRVKTYAIPSLPPETIKKEYLDKLPISLHERLKNSEEIIKSLLANILWWISKGGRPGLVEKILKEGVIEAIVNNLIYVASSGKFEDIKYCFEPVDNYEKAEKIRKVLGFDIVEGIPFARYSEYENLVIVAENYDSKLANLAKVLACTGGPLPEFVVQALGINVKGLHIPRELGIIVTNKVLNKDKIINKFLNYILSVEGSINENLRKDTKHILDEILSAWSLNNKVLYDKESLVELFGDLLQIKALEDVNVNLLNLLLKLNIERFVNELADDVQEDSMYYYALKIDVLRSLYPHALVQPIIGCAKGEDIITIVNTIDANAYDTLLSRIYSLKTVNDFVNEVKSSKNIVVNIYPLFGERSLEYVITQLDQHVRNLELVLILTFSSIPMLRKYNYPSAEKIKEVLAQKFGDQILKLLNKTIFIEEVPITLAQYLLSLLYSMIKCPDKLSKLDVLDRVVQIQTSQQFKDFLADVLKEYGDFRTKLEQQITELRRSVEDLEALTESAEHEVGSAQGRYIWGITVSDDATTVLAKFIDSLKLLRSLEDLVINQYRYKIEEREILTARIGLLLSNGERYLNRSRRVYEKLKAVLQREDLKELRGFLEGIIYMYIGDVRTYGIIKTMDKFSRNIWEEHIKYELPEAGKRMLLGALLKQYMNKLGIAPSTNVIDMIKDLVNAAKQVKDIIDEINNVQKKLINNLLMFVSGIKLPLPVLDNYRSSTDKFINEMDSIAKEINESSDMYGKTILSEYIHYIIHGNDLINKLKNYRGVLSGIRSSLLKLNVLIEEIGSLKGKFEKLKSMQIADAIDDDLRNITTILIEKMNREGIKREILESAIKELTVYLEKLKRLEKEIGGIDSELKKVYEYVNDIKSLLT